MSPIADNPGLRREVHDVFLPVFANGIKTKQPFFHKEIVMTDLTFTQ